MIPSGATFIQRPAEVTRAQEGHTAVLRCQTDRFYPLRSWTKGLQGALFKDQNFQNATRSIPMVSRVKFIGDLSVNDYSIEINNVIPSDADTYKCQATPDDQDEGIGQANLWLVATRLEVIPTPTLTMPPSVEPANSPATVQEHHHYSPINSHQSASLESGINSLEATGGAPSSKPPFNNNKAREAYPGARELDRNNQITSTGMFISPSSSAFINNYNGHHHATVRASTAYPSISGSGSAGLVSGALVWPYLLLAIAAFLMVANIYLIYSLIKRHTRCSKENEANETQEDDSSMA